MKKPIILAPAGEWSALIAAANAGADAIYFGASKLNMRSHSANNFTIDDLKEISNYCKEKTIKTYLTVNTVMYDEDLSLMKKTIDKAKQAKIDAIIASDLATVSYAKSIKMTTHLSTQMNISNVEAIKFFSDYADAIVLARELSLEQITHICNEIKKQNILGPNKKPIKIEIFAHGALCVAISGKCYMSLANYNMSANRGKCLQSCRRKYRVIEEDTKKELLLDNKYIMSPKDLCTLPFLDKILESGVSILKIEGRARSPEYVKTVIEVYSEAIEAIENNIFTKEKIEALTTKLKTVYNRDFWYGGYYLNKTLDIWSNKPNSKATTKKSYVAKVTNFFSKIGVCEAIIQAGEISIGDSILIIGNKTGVVESKIKNLQNPNRVTKAKKGDTISFLLDKKIRKNDSIYILEKI